MFIRLYKLSFSVQISKEIQALQNVNVCVCGKGSH